MDKLAKFCTLLQNTPNSPKSRQQKLQTTKLKFLLFISFKLALKTQTTNKFKWFLDKSVSDMSKVCFTFQIDIQIWLLKENTFKHFYKALSC